VDRATAYETGAKLMKRPHTKAVFAALAMGGISLITTATCDPVTGAFDFYRDDDFDDCCYDDYYYDDYYYYYDDCYYFDCY
jgi:hypothetical protein